MTTLPELIVFSQYLLGGGASFHRNLLSYAPEEAFELKVIYLYPKAEAFTPSLEFVKRPGDVIFDYGDERLYNVAKRLSSHISNKEGVIVANLGIELDCLDLFPKDRKTIYFICHDSGFLALAKRFAHIIDVLIAHNSEIFDLLKKLLPDRVEDIFFIPHGVKVQRFIRTANLNSKLRIAFLARHHVMKGIYDLPEINRMIIDAGVEVEWLVMGDGQERQKFIAQTSNLANFRFSKPDTNSEVLEALKQCDLFILPSRKDGLPVALLEAMSVGCVPLVSAFSEGIREVVTPGIGHVAAVGDNKGFADRIVWLHRNREVLSTQSKNAADSIADHYDVKERAKDYFTLYADYAKLKKNTRGSQLARTVRRIYELCKAKIAIKAVIQLKRKLFDSPG